MFKQGVMATAFVVVMGAVPVLGQTTRAEVGFTVGWVFSDGVTTDSPVLVNGELYDRIDPKDSFAWGFNVGVPVSPNVEVGFLFGQQMSALVADGTAKTEAGDMTVSTYHGYVGYNFLESDAPLRPYFLFGLGATSYGSVDYTTRTGAAGEIGGFSQFSTTWGAGVKGYASPNFGFKTAIQQVLLVRIPADKDIGMAAKIEHAPSLCHVQARPEAFSPGQIHQHGSHRRSRERPKYQRPNAVPCKRQHHRRHGR